MDKGAGKLINCDSQAELPFSILPSEFRVENQFDFTIEHCLGQSSPIVSFQSGGEKNLHVHLVFDRDADEKLDLSKVTRFIHDIEKINQKTKSIPVLNFKMGSFSFKGYAKKLNWTSARFDKNGDSSVLKIDLTLIHSEEGNHDSI